MSSDAQCWLQQQVCQWQDIRSPEDFWQVQLEQEPHYRLFELTVAAPQSFQEDSLTLIWRGLDMELGVYPRRLQYQSSTPEARLYSLQMSLPLCSVDQQMSWQLELSHEETPILAPFTLVYTRP